MARVERVSVGGSGLEIARVLTGLWQMADMERDGKQVDLRHCAESMSAYADAGLSTFDMADHYGSAEDVAGIFCKEIIGDPTQVQMLTKWCPKPGVMDRAEVEKAVDISLKRLRTDKIDLLQFHWWDFKDPRYLDAMHELKKLRAEGKIRELGVTNVDTSHLRLLIRDGVPIATNQVCFSVLDTRARKPRGMCEFCAQEGVKILAFGVLGGGFISEKWLGKEEPAAEELQTWSQMKYKRFIDICGWEQFQLTLRVLDQVARRHSVSIACVATRWVLQQPGVGGVIIGARLGISEHISDTTKLFSFELGQADMDEIQAVIDARPRQIPGDCGDEYRRPPFLTAQGDLSHHLDALPPVYEQRDGCSGTRVQSGTVWEDIAGFSRGARIGNIIAVAGTTATHGSRCVGGKDAAAQATFVCDKLEAAVTSLGGRLQDVIRTRVFVKRIADWEPVARAHGEKFGDVRPANSLVQADLVGDDYLVEIEADAVVAG
mmetsp:Transcript_51337/g.135274  ORF Transcript_51337/g.135274 Transcript_51337/m.135274 type:complete len:489 (+) Transcript_51337:45-1511(+)